MSGPRVAVVIPVFDMRAWIAEAIESALSQCVAADTIEIVVVDDGSTDDSGAIAARYAPRVRCLRQANRGLSAARNAGIAATSAPLVQLLDADDRLHPEKVAASLPPFTDPAVGVVYTGVRYVDEAGSVLPQHGWARTEGEVLPSLVLGNLHTPHQPLTRRTAIAAAGGFDETLTSLEDWDLWLRIALAGWHWRCIDRALVDYRVRPSGMHRNAGRMAANRRRVLDAFFRRADLPPAVRALETHAVARAELVAACEHYRTGERAAGARALRAAARAEPPILTDPRLLRLVWRWLLPLGSQADAEVVAAWRPLARMVRRMLDDLFAAPDLEPELAALRPRARRAFWQLTLRLVRKRATTGGWLRPRTAVQRT